MFYSSLHHRWLRIFTAIGGEFIIAAAGRLFLVPLGLYSSGIMGVCQLLRTLLQDALGLSLGAYDIAGILYYLVNIPMLIWALKALGRGLVWKTIVCTTAYSVFYSLIPTPATLIISDYLTSCLIGGILSGIGCGIVLTCGCSGGGLEIVGLYLSKTGSSFTIGRVSILFNLFLYSVCLILFSPEIAIYSIIYNVFSSLVLDRMHKQNINVQALIFTKADTQTIGQTILEKLNRGVTYWQGTGAFSGEEVHVLCVCLSKNEIEDLIRTVHVIDPNAFLTTQEGTRIYGNFQKKLD